MLGPRIKTVLAAIGRETLVLLALALAVRLLWWSAWVVVLENEGISYVRLAENWLDGVGYVNTRGAREVMIPPLYPALIAAAGVVVRDFDVAARLISLLGGLTIVICVHRLTLLLFGRIAARVAGVFAALHPVLVALSVSAYSESLGMALTIVALQLAVGASQTGSAWRAAGAGVAIGLGYLTRPELIALVAPVALYFVVVRARTGNRIRGLRDAALCIAVALALAAPYSVYLSRIAGTFRWEGKTSSNELINERLSRGMSLMQASRGLDVADDFERHAHDLGGPDLSKDLTVFPREAAKGRGIGDVLAAVPRRLPGVVAFVALTAAQWTSILKLPLGLVALALGLTVTRWWKQPSRLEAALLLTFLGIQGAFLIGVLFLWARYVYPLLPLAIPWMSVGGVVLLDFLARRVRSIDADRCDRLVTAIAIALLAVMSAASVRRVAWLDDFQQSGDGVIRDAGRWLRTQTPPSGRERPLVMAARGGVMHYARGTLTLLPYTDDMQRALRYIAWKRPDYIAVTSQQVSAAPYLASWLREGIRDSCAVPLRRFESPHNTVALWRWTCGH